MDPNREIHVNQETQELIDSYLLGRLDNVQLENFNERLKTDPGFSKILEEQKAMIKGVEEHNLRKSLDDYHTEIVEVPKKRWLAPALVALAASVLILIGVSIWAIFNSDNTAQKVFAENFRPDPGLPTTMGTASQYEFYYGMVSYKRKEYTEAISRWEPLYAAQPKNDTLVYFLGVANLANGNARQAENYLKLANEKTESAFYEDIQYYLALAYLKENKIKEAKEILSKNNSPAGIKLLKQIKSL
ncbi:MAG: tetratricopeptide repeat protein [Aequorivita sp.]